MQKPVASQADGLHFDTTIGGISSYLHFDDAAETFAVEAVQDVEPILDNAKALAAMENAGKSKSGEWYHAGRFPQVIVEEWLRLKGLTMQDLRGEVVDMFLNDPAHSAFRIWNGNL